MWDTSFSKSQFFTQKFALLSLSIHPDNHLFEVTGLFCSLFFFFFENSVPTTQAELPTVCLVYTLKQNAICKKTENKTKWINLNFKRRQLKAQIKTNSKNPTGSTYNSNSCFVQKPPLPLACRRKISLQCASHVSTPKLLTMKASGFNKICYF